MAIYHLNPFSGEPRVCNAQLGNCPWGKPNEHYASKEDARAAYEETMKDFALSSTERIFKLDTDRDDAPIEFGEERFLPKEKVQQISTEGITCQNCGAEIAAQLAAEILDPNIVSECAKCGNDLDIETISVEVSKNKSTYPAFVKENVYGMVWYHSTNVDNWEETLNEGEGFYAHLGSSQASLDRQIAEKYSQPSSPKEGFWLFEVEIDPSSKIDDEVRPDDNEDYNAYEYSDTYQRIESDVVRYINRYEDMASISLVAISNKIKVLRKRFVEYDEAVRSLSLYNVKVNS